MTKNTNIQLLRQFSHLLDFSNDMVRNREDAQWADDGNEIIYVLDTSVFSSFIRPDKWRHSMSVLSWPEAHLDKQSVAFHEAYSAMIAAEYLVSASAPGARAGQLYLTPWQGIELSNYLKKEHTSLTSELKKSAQAGDNSARLNEEVARKIDLIKRARSTLAKNKSPIDRNQITLDAAKILLRSKVIEPLDQLFRLTSKSIRSRFKILDSRFSPNQDESAYIWKEANFWFRRIIGEFESKKHRSNRKPMHSVWNDALSMAYVLWISDYKLREDQKVVFVTADTGVFDVYRRWFIGQDARSEEFYSPFCLRRLSQFAPLINLTDAKSDVSDALSDREKALSIFDDVSNSVELALVPFNLSARSDKPKDAFHQMVSRRGRELLALEWKSKIEVGNTSSLDMYSLTLENDWFIDQSKRLKNIGKLWNQLQDAAIGLFFNFVKRRLDDGFGLNIDDIEALESIGGQQLALDHFQELAISLADEASQGAIATAVRIIDTSEFSPGPNTRRIPKTIWYKVQTEKTVEEFLKDWRYGIKASNSADLKPASVFVIAAALSLSQSDWSSADQYSKRALRLEEKGKFNSNLLEARFLRAVSCRFNLGFIGAHLEGYGRAPSQEVLNQCFKLIEAAYHEASTELETLIVSIQRMDIDRDLQLFRVQSELIALKMFYFSSLSTSEFLRERATVAKILQILASEIRELITDCFKVRSAIKIQDDRFHEIDSQYLINSAAIDVLEFVTLKSETRLPVSIAHLVKSKIVKNDSIVIASRSAVVKAEVYAFSVLYNLPGQTAFWDLEDAIYSGRSSPLALDRAIIQSLDDAKGQLLEAREN